MSGEIVTTKQIITACVTWNRSGEKHAQDMIQLGYLLHQKKEEVGHGNFEKFVKAELPISLEKARICRKAYEFYADDLLPENCQTSDIYKALKGEVKSPTIGDLGVNKGLMNENDENQPESDDYNELESGEDYEEYEPNNPGIIDGGSLIQVDRFKQEIPEKLQSVLIGVAAQYNELRKKTNDIANTLKNFVGEPGHERLEKRDIGPAFRNIKELIKFARPYCVCPLCGGDGGTGSKCGQCKGKGWLTEAEFNTVPKEIKESFE